MNEIVPFLFYSVETRGIEIEAIHNSKNNPLVFHECISIDIDRKSKLCVYF